jgi:hypothetical protein
MIFHVYSVDNYELKQNHKIYNSMSSLNVFQVFLNEEVNRDKMDLTKPLTAVLDYLEYLIRVEFNVNDKSHILKKNRKLELNKEFRAAITTLSRE